MTESEKPASEVPYVPQRGRLAELWHRFDPVDQAIATFMERVGVRLLRISIAIVFVWFGALKLFDLSPAADLVRATVYWLPGDVFLPILGVWEVLIGLFNLALVSAALVVGGTARVGPRNQGRLM
ncbi:MAG: hypothetical protein WEA34_09365 [Gemmatimonadota bacterium]